MRHLPLLALVAGLAAPLAGHAAAVRDDVGSARASYAGLDLNRGRDAGVMLTRLRTAALEACGASDFSFREYRAAVVKSACYQEGLRRAVQDLNAPKVTGLYQDQPAFSLASK